MMKEVEGNLKDENKSYVSAESDDRHKIIFIGRSIKYFFKILLRKLENLLTGLL